MARQEPCEARPKAWIGLLLWASLAGTALFVPAYPLGFLDGIPADSLMDFVAAIGLAAWILPRDFARLSARRGLLLFGLVAVCAGLRVLSARAYGTHGLPARYESELRPGQFELERSTSCHVPGATRVDGVIDFEGVGVGIGRKPLWADFLNTVRPASTVADRLAGRLYVCWSGSVRPDRDCRLAVEATCPCTLAVGRGNLLRAGGNYPIRLEARFPNLHSPHLRLVTADNGRTVPGRWLSPNPRGSSRPTVAAGLAVLSWGTLLATLWLLARTVDLAAWPLPIEVWGKCVLVLAALASGAWAWERHLARDPTFSINPPDDYLLYENEARTLAFQGFRRDDGMAFHRSPAMRYYLVAAHAVFGESGYGVILLQQVLRGGVAVLVLVLVRLMTDRSGLAWVASVVVLVLPSPLDLSLHYWPEAVGAFVFALVCLRLVRGQCRASSVWRDAVTGLAVGLLALVRTNAVSLVPGVALWLLLRKCRLGAAAFFLSAASVLAFVPIRNYLVTRQWVLTPTEGAITMVLGNNIPRGTDISSAYTGVPADDALLRRGMEHLWEFDNNPAASYDVFDPPDNARMHHALVRVWLAYVARHPGHYARQVLARAWFWFFPNWNVASLLSACAFLGVGLRAQRRDAAWWALVFAFAVYSLPFLIAYFEPRHRAVVLPELCVLALVGLADLLRYLRRERCVFREVDPESPVARAA
jgi:4-amino-4-deoxy-L-arabinose transferase-like glycosyltransferase